MTCFRGLPSKDCSAELHQCVGMVPGGRARTPATSHGTGFRVRGATKGGQGTKQSTPTETLDSPGTTNNQTTRPQTKGTLFTKPSTALVMA